LWKGDGKMKPKFGIGAKLPLLGILAFSGCSVNALANLLLARAAHPTPWLWGAAALVELTTAWLVYQVVEQARMVTRSRISKQDRRFYGLMLGAFAVLTVPSLALSVWANALEFGSPALGLVFPMLSVGAAVGAALPATVSRHEKGKAEAKAEADRKRAEADRQRAERQAETIRQQLEAERKLAERDRQRAVAALENLGNMAETLKLYLERPKATQSEAAATLGMSERTIRNHLGRLEDMGIVKRNGRGVELLVDLPVTWSGGN